MAGLAILILSGTLWTGCGDEPLTEPLDDQPIDIFDGSLDPGSGSFTLKAAEVFPPEGPSARILLIGSNMQVDATNELVSIDVSIQNDSQVPLYAPAEIWITDIFPDGVTVLNSDFPASPELAGSLADSSDTTPGPAGFDYSGSLGEDGVLSPGELSLPRNWTFSDPRLAPFSFSIIPLFDFAPPGAHISGRVFSDGNRNGIQDPGEPPFGLGWVRLPMTDDLNRPDSPTGNAQMVPVNGDGTYRLTVREAGLYQVQYILPPLLSPLPLEVTTPNPLAVLLTPGLDGEPQSFDHANFGVFHGPLIPPILLTDLPPEEIAGDPYTLLELRLEGRVLAARVGFSGCNGGHPFDLYAFGGFMESNPVQVNVLLSHDSRGELCEAWWEEARAYDLRPLLEAYQDAYGRLDPIILRFHDPNGQVHKLLFEP